MVKFSVGYKFVDNCLVILQRITDLHSTIQHSEIEIENSFQLIKSIQLNQYAFSYYFLFYKA